MRAQITSIEYNFDWIMKGRNFHPRETPGALTREEVVAFHGTLGLDGLELMHLYWDDYRAADLKRLAANAGLSIVSYVFFVDLIRPPEARRAALDEARALLDRTAELSAPLAMLIAATQPVGQGTLAQQRGWLVEGLRASAEYAQSVGVTVVAENIDFPPLRPLMGRGTQCRDLCAEVASPAFRLIYDGAASLLVDEDPLDALRAMAPYLAHAHAKNFRPLAPGEPAARSLVSANGQTYTGAALDEGIVDLPRILAEMDRLGYAGRVLVEYQGEADPRQALPRSINYLRNLLEGTGDPRHD